MRFSSLALCCALGSALAGCGGTTSSAIPIQGAAQSAISPALEAPTYIAAANSEVALSGSAASNPYNALVLSNNPLAYYELGDGGSSMLDQGAYHLNGTYGAGVRHDGGIFTSAGNHSAIFPGSPSGANAAANSGTVRANAAFARASRGVTIEAWVKASDWNRSGNFEPLVSYGRDAEGEPWIIELTPESSVQFFFKTNSGAGHYLLKPGTAKIIPSQVFQVVATYDGANAKVYVNGNLDGSMPATGTLNYGGVQPQYGLSIGAALGGSRPVFNGAISNVSIYPTALSAAEVENHFVRGQMATPLNETPVSSDAFVDSIGVNTHVSGSNSPYEKPWSTFAELIKSSGIRHIRDGLAGSPTWYPQHINELGAAGIHASLITDLSQSSATIESTLALFGRSVEAVEGLNEPDDHGQAASVWVPATRAFQHMLWSTIKGHSATAGLHVVGPSTIWEGNAVALGDLSRYMDRGDAHDYFGGYNPGTVGWGPLDEYGVYGSITYNVNVSKVIGGSNPVWATETGYKDVGSNSVDDRTLARYVPRLFLENFLHGISHTAIYDFYDDVNNTPSSNFGLVRADNQPKPSYYAIKNLIHALSDRGSGFSTRALSYVLGGNTSNVRHLLLQKRDGTYELVLWVETQSYDPNAQRDLTVPAQTVTVKPASAPASATITTIGDSGSSASRGITFAGGVASFAIDDHVSIISFK